MLKLTQVGKYVRLKKKKGATRVFSVWKEGREKTLEDGEGRAGLIQKYIVQICLSTGHPGGSQGDKARQVRWYHLVKALNFIF